MHHASPCCLLLGFIAENFVVDIYFCVYIYENICPHSHLADWSEAGLGELLQGELMNLPPAMTAHPAMITPLICRDTPPQKKTEVCTHCRSHLRVKGQSGVYNKHL